jgi:ribosomal protein S18 acetylase RimI-like enzyme
LKALTELLARSHDRAGFDCGVVALNKYLHQFALQDQQRGLATTFCQLAAGTNTIVGYYSLAAHSILLVDLTPALQQKAGVYPQVPVALLARLAVSSHYQEKGVGRVLLTDAFWRIMTAPLACHGVVVDPSDVAIGAFYQRLGFVPLGTSTNRLFLPLATLRQAAKY